MTSTTAPATSMTTRMALARAVDGPAETRTDVHIPALVRPPVRAGATPDTRTARIETPALNASTRSSTCGTNFTAGNTVAVRVASHRTHRYAINAPSPPPVRATNAASLIRSDITWRRSAP